MGGCPDPPILRGDAPAYIGARGESWFCYTMLRGAYSQRNCYKTVYIQAQIHECQLFTIHAQPVRSVAVFSVRRTALIEDSKQWGI